MEDEPGVAGVECPSEGEFGTEDGLRNAVDVLEGVRACADRDEGSYGARPAELLAMEARY